MLPKTYNKQTLVSECWGWKIDWCFQTVHTLRLFGVHLVNDSKGVFALALLNIFWSAGDLEASSESKGLVAYCTSVINNFRFSTYSMHQCTHWFVRTSCLGRGVGLWMFVSQCVFLFFTRCIFVLHNQWVELGLARWTLQYYLWKSLF